jgi:hypothetical protein
MCSEVLFHSLFLITFYREQSQTHPDNPQTRGPLQICILCFYTTSLLIMKILSIQIFPQN